MEDSLINTINEDDKLPQKIQKLLVFKDDDYANVMPFTKRVSVYIEMLLEATPPIIQILSTTFGSFLGFYLLKGKDHPEMEASMGLYISIYNFFCKMIALSVGEQTGIVSSELYGARKYKEMKQNFVYSMMTSTAALLFLVFPIYLFSYQILTLIGAEHAVAYLTSSLLYTSFPIALTTVYGEQIKAYCYSQGIE